MSVTWLLRTGHDLHLHFQKNTTAAVSWLAVIRAGEPGICFALQVIEHGLLKEDSRTAKKLPLHMLGFVVLAASHNTSRPMWSTPWSLLLCICHLSLLWPLQFHHRSTAGPSSGSLRPRNRLLVIARKQGLLTEESTRRAVMSSAAVGAAASGALLVGAAGFRFGAALVVSGGTRHSWIVASLQTTAISFLSTFPIFRTSQSTAAPLRFFSCGSNRGATGRKRESDSGEIVLPCTDLPPRL